MARCEEPFGFFPCADNALGSSFLIAAHGSLVLLGAWLSHSAAAAVVRLRLAPALAQSVVQPLAGGLPDAIFILAAGLYGARAAAQQQVDVSMGALAGGALLLMASLWGGAVLAQRSELAPKCTQQQGDAPPRPWWDLRGSGVTPSAAAESAAVVTAATALLYLVVEVPALFGARSPRIALAGSVLCLIVLAAHTCYQALAPLLRRRAALAAHRRYLRCKAVRSLAWWAADRCGGILAPPQPKQTPDAAAPCCGGGAACHADRPRVSRLATGRLFAKFDRDGDGALDVSELRAMLVALEVERRGGAGARRLDAHAALFLAEMDSDGDGALSPEEFHAGVERWVDYKLRCQVQDSSPSLPARVRAWCGGGTAAAVATEAGSPSGSRRKDKRSGSAADLLTKLPVDVERGMLTVPLLSGEGGVAAVDSPAPPAAALLGGASASGVAGQLLASCASSGEISASSFGGCASDAGEGFGGGSEVGAGGGGDCGATSSRGSSSGGAACEQSARRAALLSAAARGSAGVAACAVFAAPLACAVSDFAAQSGVPAFCVAFVTAPLACNAPRLAGVVQTMREGHGPRADILSQAYQALAVSNTLCAGLLMLVASRTHLPWAYTLEVLCMLLPLALVCWLVLPRRALPALWALPVMCAYPGTLLLTLLVLRGRHASGVAP